MTIFASIQLQILVYIVHYFVNLKAGSQFIEYESFKIKYSLYFVNWNPGCHFIEQIEIALQ